MTTDRKKPAIIDVSEEDNWKPAYDYFGPFSVEPIKVLIIATSEQSTDRAGAVMLSLPKVSEVS